MIVNYNFKPLQYRPQSNFLEPRQNTAKFNVRSFDIVHELAWLSQVRLGWVRLGQVRLGQVRLGQVRLGQVRLHTFKLMCMQHQQNRALPKVKQLLDCQIDLLLRLHQGSISLTFWRQSKAAFAQRNNRVCELTKASEVLLYRRYRNETTQL